MVWFWSILLVIVNTFFLLTVPFMVPGNWLIITVSGLFAWWQKDTISLYSLAAAAAVALAAEVIEFIAAAGSAKSAGASWKGSLAAIAGAITGAILGTFLIPIPIAGTIIGSCIGAGMSVWFVEAKITKKHSSPLKLGIAAGLGQSLASVSKFIAGCVIWLIITVAVFIN